MLHRYVITLIICFSFSLAFGQLFYSDYSDIYSYDLDSEQETRIVSISDYTDFSQFCINHSTGEIYGSDFNSIFFTGVYDLEGRQIFETELEIDISSGQSDAMILDERNNIIYSTRGGLLEVHDIDGNNSNMTIVSGSNIHGIALDTTNNKIYYSDRGTNRIYKVNLDGTENEEIIHLPSGLADPQGIFLDIEEGKIYWANTGQKKIQRANLDGSEIEDVVLGFDTPVNVAVNFERDEIYITDIGEGAIYRYNLDTDILDPLYADDDSYPSSIELDQKTGFLYWIDGSLNTLERIDISTGENIGVIANGGYVSQFVIDELQEYIFVPADQGLIRYNHDGSFGTIIKGPSGQNLALDILTEEIYYMNGYWSIHKTNYDGTIDEEVYQSENFEDVGNLIFDGLTKTLFWLEDGNIYRSNTLNFSKEIFLDFEDNISLFTLDYINSKIYFKSGSLIYYTNFDGSDTEPIIGTAVRHLVIDPIKERLFYSNNEGIFTAELNGFFEEQFLDANFVDKFTFGSTDGYLVIPTVATEAIVSGTTIDLSWSVSPDFDGMGGSFEIEKRSMDGSFENIGSVEYLEGTLSYLFVDENPIEGENEYRLMYFTEESGLTSYSKYFSTDYSTTNTIDISGIGELYYNFSGAHFVNNGTTGNLTIYTLDGQNMKQVALDSNVERIDMSALQEGIYFYTLLRNDKSTIEGRFVRF